VLTQLTVLLTISDRLADAADPHKCRQVYTVHFPDMSVMADDLINYVANKFQWNSRYPSSSARQLCQHTGQLCQHTGQLCQHAGQLCQQVWCIIDV